MIDTLHLTASNHHLDKAKSVFFHGWTTNVRELLTEKAKERKCIIGEVRVSGIVMIYYYGRFLHLFREKEDGA